MKNIVDIVLPFLSLLRAPSLSLSLCPSLSQKKGRRGTDSEWQYAVLKEKTDTRGSLCSERPDDSDKAKPDLETRNWDQPQMR